MKSQRIRIRNLPQDPAFFEKSVNVKPTMAIIGIFVLGAILLFLKPYLAVTGALLMILAVFCVVVMPDRILCKFSKEYLVVYNQRDRDYCKLLYWDEIVSWQYEWHNSYDQLVIYMVDGTVETQEMYSLRSVKANMMMHAKNKMKNPVRIRRELT